jgi:hypothetical protein
LITPLTLVAIELLYFALDVFLDSGRNKLGRLLKGEGCSDRGAVVFELLDNGSHLGVVAGGVLVHAMEIPEGSGGRRACIVIVVLDLAAEGRIQGILIDKQIGEEIGMVILCLGRVRVTRWNVGKPHMAFVRNAV